MRGGRGSVRVLAAVATAVAWACGDDLPSLGAASSSTAPPGSSGGSSSGSGDHAPEIVDIGQDVLLLREGAAVVLTAAVLDLDEDVIHGELFGPGEPTKYADLSPHPSGRWTASVGWSDVHSHFPLQFEGELELPFTVRMSDAAGHVAEAGTVLRAACGGISGIACGGACIDPQVDSLHCGGCDRPCEVKEPLRGRLANGGCIGGLCQPWWGECSAPAPGSTCADRCAGEGARCVVQGCDGATLMSHDVGALCELGEPGIFQVIECDADLGASAATAAAVRCCCE